MSDRSVPDAEIPAPQRRVLPGSFGRSSGFGDVMRGWTRQTLAGQFLILGGLVAVLAMLMVGAIVARLIEDVVTRNAAATTALYVDSVIAPLLPDMQRTRNLEEQDRRALDETLGQGALASRLVSFRLSAADGTVLYAQDGNLIGQRLAHDDMATRALRGRVTADFGLYGAADAPVLRIYSPVLQPWSGHVVGVLRFDETAPDLLRDLWRARLRSWIAVAGATIGLFLALSLVVLRGSRTIDRQRIDLGRQVKELSVLLAQNQELHRRVQGASRRATALNESYLRRVGADLHDGPAQLIALAALRLEGGSKGTRRRADFEREAQAAKAHLDDALKEIRSICNGLVLPQVETATAAEIVRQVARAHENRTGTRVRLDLADVPGAVSPPEKICIYRFVQEALTNSFRHAAGEGQSVSMRTQGCALVIEVSDKGPGFSPSARKPGSLGLSGLRDRIESIGGTFEVESCPCGTVLRMALSMDGRAKE